MSGDGENRAAREWSAATVLAPKESIAWNALGDYYGEHGPAEKAFRAYERAIALAPTDPVILNDFTLALAMSSQSSTKYYGMDYQQVIDKAVGAVNSPSARQGAPSYALASRAGEILLPLPAASDERCPRPRGSTR